MPKSWSEKYLLPEKQEVKRQEKSFADMPEGCLMLIATPQVIDHYIQSIPMGTAVSIPVLRNDLALAHQAEKTCPLTTGIFLRIVAEKAFEEYSMVNLSKLLRHSGGLFLRECPSPKNSDVVKIFC
jgi:hypothetical protein